MESYKEYLKRLNKLNEYNIFLKKYKKKDNIYKKIRLVFLWRCV